MNTTSQNTRIAYKAANDYWMSKLQDITIPTYSLGIGDKEGSDRLAGQVPATTKALVSHVAKGRDLASSMVYLTVFRALRYHYFRDVDGVTCLPPQKGKEEQQPVYLLLSVNSDTTLRHILKACSEGWKAAYQHAAYEREELAALLASRGFSLEGIGQVAYFDERLHQQHDMSASALGLSLLGEEGAVFEWVYDAVKFPEVYMQQWAGHYLKALACFKEWLDLPIVDWPLLSEEEKLQQLNVWNRTGVDYPDKATLHGLFEEQVKSNGSRTAVADDRQSLTYQALDHAANQLASHLREAYGVGRNDRVAVMLDRGVPLWVALLAVLKTGAAYVPIGTSFPDSRVEFILQDVTPKAMIATSSEVFSDTEIPTLYMDSDEWEHQGGENQLEPVSPDATACIIYTSGSTGTPKGVAVAHRGVVNRIAWQWQALGYGQNDVVLQKTTPTFDVSVWELFMPLAFGARAVACETVTAHDPQLLCEAIERHHVTNLHFVPSMFQAFLENLDTEQLSQTKTLRSIVTSGEALKADTVDKHYDKFPSVPLHNLYGPTEASIDVSWHQAQPGQSVVPIGKPIQNIKLHICDENGRLLPAGAVGEINIAGIGLAHGYVNQPKLTADKFVAGALPLRETTYRTGDLGRWLPNGEIAYMGRTDHQVKLRGFRIELGEIESVLLRHQAVNACAVLLKASPDRLVAFLVGAGQGQEENLHAHMEANLPAYMVVHQLVHIAEMPLTPSGKADRKALACLEEGGGMVGQYTPPQSDEEKLLVEVWQAVLQKEQVGITDNFFHLGGDSIVAIQVVSRLAASGYQLQVKQLLKDPYIDRLAQIMERRQNMASQALVTGRSRLAPMQWHLVVHNGVHMHHFNQVMSLAVDSLPTIDRLRQLFAQLAQHHDMLRFTYHVEDNYPYGYIHDGQAIPEVLEASLQSEADEQKDLEQLVTEAQASFNLQSGPLLKAIAVRSTTQDYLLLIAHHLIIDGVSWRILLEDLHTLWQMPEATDLKDGVLPNKSFSYRDWVEKLYEEAGQATFEEVAREYWPVAKEKDMPALPGQAMAAPDLVRDAAYCHVLFDQDMTEALRGPLNKPFNTDLQDFLLAAVSDVLAVWVGAQSLPIMLEGHGRETWGSFAEVDLSRTVGWFTSIYPVYLTRQTGLQDQLIHVKECLRRVPFQGMGYGMERYLGEAATPEAVRYPVSFNYLGSFDGVTQTTGAFKLVDVPVGPIQAPDGPRQFALEVSAVVVEGRLRLALAYNRLYHTQRDMEQLLDQIKGSLEALANMAASQQRRIYTPTDFRYKALTLQQASELGETEALEEVMPLSPMQEGILFHALMAPDSAAYFEQVSMTLQGKLDIARLTVCFQMLGERHSVLKARIWGQASGTTLQIISAQRPLPVIQEDFSDEGNQQAAIEAWKQTDRQQGFDLYSEPLTRLGILKIAEDTHEIVWSHHHIIMDGWCLGIVLGDLFALYGQQGTPSLGNLSPVAPYAAYIDWLDTVDRKAAEAYWNAYLNGFGEASTLSMHKETGANGQGSQRLRLGKVVSTALKASAQKQEVTLNTTIQALWGVLLHKLVRQTDILFGGVVSGRPAELPGVEQMVGLFINTLPVRLQIGQEDTVWGVAARLQGDAIEATPYHHFPLADIQAMRGAKQVLFDHIMVFDNYPVADQLQQISQQADQLPEVVGMGLVEATHYGLTVIVVPGEDIEVRFEYDKATYTDAQMAQVSSCFERLAQQAIETSDTPIASLRLLSDSQRKALLAHNPKPVSYPDGENVPVLLEACASQNPDKLALVCAEDRYTYQALEALTNQVANYLLASYDIGPDVCVGVMLHRSAWSVIAMNAVLKTGACYLPIDPTLPAERIDYIVNDAKPVVIFTQAACEAALPHEWQNRLCMVEGHEWQDFADQSPDIKIEADSLSYIIYTSGSTGTPKGVAQTHRTVHNLIRWDIDHSGIAGGLRQLQYSAFGFDSSLHDAWFVLSNGGTLYVATDELRTDFEALSTYVVQEGIEVFSVPFSALDAFFSIYGDSGLSGHQLKHLISTGEQLLVNTPLKQFLEANPAVCLHNFYGPSETHVVTAAKLSAAMGNITERPTIGYPLTNARLYVLDEQYHLMPEGVPGQIFIAGEYLAKGYLGKMALTSQRFVDDPFYPGEKMYASGDLGRWLPDRQIEYLGRIDDQVKIRGFRVEPGEVEAQVLRLPGIQKAVVVASEQAGEQTLLAFVVTGEKFDETKAKQQLATVLPVYMVPANMQQIETFPLTPNGKVDKRALVSTMATMVTRKGYEPPVGRFEEALQAVWQDVLACEQIGVTDDFFDLGGHSIKAIKLGNLVQARLQQQLTVRQVFEHPTIRAQASLLEKEGVDSLPPIKSLAGAADYPLSPGQERLWVLWQLGTDMAAYNMPGIFELSALPDEGMLRQALASVIKQNHSLRTVFVEQDGEPRQAIIEPGEAWWQQVWEEVELSGESLDSEATHQLVLERAQRAFDMENGPLLRVSLVKQPQSGKALLLLVMSHMISDGWSMQVLLTTWLTAYGRLAQGESVALPALEIQYPDFAVWQRDLLASGTGDKEKAYWLSQMAGPLPMMNLPTDRPRPNIKTYEGAVYKAVIHDSAVAGLRHLVKEEGGSLYMGLLAALSAFFYRYTGGQRDMVIGSPMAGRQHPLLKDQIGLFLNTLPLRVQPDGTQGFGALLSQAKTVALGALDNQNLPFQELVEHLNVRRDLSREPLFDVLLVLQNMVDMTAGTTTAGGLEVKPYNQDIGLSKYDLSFNFAETTVGLALTLEYNTDLFDPETVHAMCERFERLLLGMTQQPESPIAQVPWLDEAEERYLIDTLAGKAVAYDQGTLHSLISEQAVLTADAPAIGCRGKWLTYGELERLANQVARYLTDEMGVQPGDKVGILCHRDEKMVALLLGVLKTGAAYVAIDPAYPATRITFMTEDAGLTLLVAEQAAISGGIPAELTVLSLQTLLEGATTQTTDSLPEKASPEGLAYMIYTSGSTGQPKGVQIEHCQVTAFMHWCRQEFAQSDYQLALAVTSYCFDLSVFELFFPLTVGKPVQVLGSGVEIIEVLQTATEPLLVNTVPSVVGELIAAGADLSPIAVLNMAGEPIPFHFKEHFDLGQMEVRNLYGPSEDTTYSTCYRFVQTDDVIPIGYPIANTYCYLMDENGQLTPPGVAGELCLSGAGVARGYHGRPTLTRERFGEDLFRPGNRLYKTGDLCKWRADGQLEYLGRIDNQVKVRGFRIEPGEIEKALAAHDGIGEALVAVWDSPDQGPKLVAYVQATDEELVEAAQQRIKQQLPVYMHPDYVVILEVFPRNTNGKTDRTALPAPQAKVAQEVTAATNEEEARVMACWKAVLGADELGIHHNFFEAGGNSLKAIRLFKALDSEFPNTFKVTDLFSRATIASQAAFARGQGTNGKEGEGPSEELIELTY
ncbi:amino acid adenylation domain-containing protein [Maribacter sp. 2-571]|uniref:amino acid adenylation domain-containing protein n=1 Tax=Maribacter sp. 2-571 TaxID=3417569 RepID=UPI003D32A601